MPDPGAGTLVLWDGQCGLCRRCAGWAARKDTQERLTLMPYQEAPSPPMTPELSKACERDMHVVRPDGSILKGGDAALHVLRALPGWWRIPAALFSVPPFIWAVRLGYRMVADNRSMWSRVLFRGSSPS